MDLSSYIIEITVSINAKQRYMLMMYLTDQLTWYNFVILKDDMYEKRADYIKYLFIFWVCWSSVTSKYVSDLL